jgi:hypothetical protein
MDGVKGLNLDDIDASDGSVVDPRNLSDEEMLKTRLRLEKELLTVG